MSTPAQRYRRRLWQAFSDLQQISIFCEMLEHFRVLWAFGKGKPGIDGEGSQVLACVGLLTSGQLDYVGETLELIARSPDAVCARSAGGFAEGLRFLLPFPAILDPINSPAEALAWYRTHEAALRWNEALGSFVLAEYGAGGASTDIETRRSFGSFGENSWLTGKDPLEMLDFLTDTISETSLILFGASCCRRLQHLLSRDESRVALKWVEEVMIAQPEQLSTSPQPSHSSSAGWCLPADSPATQAVFQLIAATHASERETAVRLVKSACASAALAIALAAMPRGVVDPEAWDLVTERASQSYLLRCVVGNPFSPLVPRTFPASVVGLAQACVEEDDREPWGILADALGDLGQDDAARHCREPFHAKGCYVLRWILYPSRSEIPSRSQ
jgi:hypothetical protein